MPGTSLFGQSDSGGSDNDDDSSLFPKRAKSDVHELVNDLTNSQSSGEERPTQNAHPHTDSSVDDDVRSSIIDRIAAENHDVPKNNKSNFYYTQRYHEYEGTTDDTTDEGLSDFQRYNRSLAREERIKNKVQTKRRGRNNFLTALDLSDLNSGFIHTVNEEPKPSAHRAWIWPKRTNSMHNDMYTVSTNPIDEDDTLNDLPIELQDRTKSRRRALDPREEVDFVVSNQDNLDYNLRPIDDKVIATEGQSKSFKEWVYGLNPARIIRNQINARYQIQRKLKLRHLHQIALGGTLGVGLLLSSGKAFSIAGPLGCLLGFIISGSIVVATMLSFCEIVTLIPLCGGVSGVASRFVDDAFGFALGVTYWFSYMISFPTEITAASIMLSYYSDLDIPGPGTCGWIVLFLLFAIIMNLFDVRVYGELEYFSTIIKLLIIIALMIYNIILNAGGSGMYHERIGFKFWDSKRSDLEHYMTYGPFRPTFDVNDDGLGAMNGIGGSAGRFCQVLIATVVAAYAYVGTETVIIAGSEARNPRRAIPSATSNIYWRVLVFYILSIFIVGLNIYSGDPRLLHYFTSSSNTGYLSDADSPQSEIIRILGGEHCSVNLLDWAGFSNGNQSPFVIAIQSAGLCGMASVTNAFMLYFAVTAGTAQLYSSSRTIYFMAVQGKAPKIFSVCTKSGVPYMSVLFTGAFGCLAFLSVQDNTALVFERLLSICASAGLLVWGGMCLAFIRFYHGLKLRPDIISRDDENYPYKAPLQPYLACYGMVSSFVVVIVSAFLPFLEASWSPVYFVTCLGALFVFLFCYIVYKVFRRTKVRRLDQLDLDSGRREIDRIIWEDERHYASNLKENIHRMMHFLL